MSYSWTKALLLPLTAAVCTFLILPIFIVIVLSFGNGSYLSFNVFDLSVQWYRRFLFDPRWQSAIIVSILIAVISCVIATAAGFLAAYSLVRGKYWGKNFILGAMLLPMIIPGVIAAIALYFVSGRLGLIGNVGWIAVCHSVGTLPIVMMIIIAALQGVDENLERAAFSMGASRGRTIRVVLIPLVLPAIISSALFAALGSFDELIISLFLAGVSAETLPVRIWNSLILQVEPTIAAVSAFLIFVTVVLLVVDWLIKRANTVPTS